VTKPLEGIKVADFTWALVGPITTNTLAVWGADVIKIEGRSRPDSRRISPPFKDNVPGLDRSATFYTYSLGKKSVALNLARAEGIEVAKKIVAWADVVTDNFAGGAMKRMGLSYEVLREVKPDIIMMSSCPMGQTGPYPTAPSIGVHLTALSGITNLAGWPDREATALDSYTDFVSPHFNALAILAALDYRDRTGKGQYLDLSQYEDCMHFMAPLVLDYMVNKRVSTRTGNRLDSAAPHNVYSCLGDDRWCAIAVFTNAEWASFCNVIGNPDWSRNPHFDNLASRKENEEELDRFVTAWTMNYTAEDVMRMMQASGVAAGVVSNAEDVMEKDPQLQHRRFFREIDHPELGTYRAPRPPYIFSRFDCQLGRAPMLGEHNEYVLKNIAGLTDEEISKLILDGVLE